MFQNYALFPHMNVAANVGYGLRMRGVAKPEIATPGRRRARARQAHRPGGPQAARSSPAASSSAWRSPARWSSRPKVLLLDEPFSALDRNLRGSMQVELKEIQRKLGVTTIFVTHDQGEALSLSDRIAVMSEGRIRQSGTPDEIYRRPVDRFVASFVGDVNVLRGRIDHIEGEIAAIALGTARVTVKAWLHADATKDAKVDLFVRPEDLRVAESETAAAVHGVVTTQIYQGSHVDLYVDVGEAAAGRVLLRLPGHDAMSRWPPGTRIGIAVAGDAVAFGPAG